MISDPSIVGFLADACYCGHSRFEHSTRHISTGRCHVCPDRHYFQKPEQRQAALAREAAKADPAHIHGPLSTGYACPGFVPFTYCVTCGEDVR